MAKGDRPDKLDKILFKLATLQEKQTLLIEKQNANLEILTKSVQDLTIGLQNMDAKVGQFVQRLHAQFSDFPQSPTLNLNAQTWNSTSAHSSSRIHSMHLEVPRFFGDNSSAWISQIQRYFDFYNTPDPQRLVIASFYLDGDALDWYELMRKQQLLLSWNAFLLAIENRFGMLQSANSFGKSLQTGSLLESHHMFDQLPHKVMGVPELLARSLMANSWDTTQEEKHNTIEEDTTEGDIKNTESIDSSEGLASEFVLGIRHIERHSLKHVVYLGAFATEMWHKLHAKTNLLHISVGLWVEWKVILHQNIQFPIHFRKEHLSLRWLRSIQMKKLGLKGGCPAKHLIQRYSGRKVVKKKDGVDSLRPKQWGKSIPECPASAAILEVLYVLLLPNIRLQSEDIIAPIRAIDLLGTIAVRLMHDGFLCRNDIFWILQVFFSNELTRLKSSTIVRKSSSCSPLVAPNFTTLHLEDKVLLDGMGNDTI